MKKNLSSSQVIILSFLSIILTGTFLLMLPISSKAGIVTPFKEALFTATSASCVTGLVVQDTGTYWSLFGQTIILILIQIGGMGVITISYLIFILFGKRMGLIERSYLSDSLSALSIGGIVRLTKFIVRMALMIEITGALFLLPTFLKDFGGMGIWYALFHSISAFCNAGFDLLGIREHFSSLTTYATNAAILLPIAALIVIGGIGFLTWEDLVKHKFHYHQYRLQSKVILSTTAILIGIPALYFFIFEFQNMGMKERILSSIFQSITPRTAGFNSIDYASLSQSGQLLSIVLMLIGGASGSTAGGIKVSTFAILCFTTLAIIRRQEEINMFNRRITTDIILQCVAILTLYVFLMIGSTILLASIEQIPAIRAGFECASALGTVGLTLGITPTLSSASHYLLIALMFIGRVGGLTFIFATTRNRKNKSKYPVEKITVG
ncbi:MAG: Trk family potassium uptake protein [Firmicutes bacterium]|nr:Trk family potassium uptake protein [Bacillota bacterium]